MSLTTTPETRGLLATHRVSDSKTLVRVYVVKWQRNTAVKSASPVTLVGPDRKTTPVSYQKKMLISLGTIL